MPPADITFRPKTDADRPFLSALYASTREDEMKLVAWTDVQKAEFLAMQFNAQTSHYDAYYPGAQFLVIERRGQPIGRMYIEHRPDEIALIDIALIPQERGAGLGTFLIRELLDEAVQAGKPVGIHVEHFNPALRLYQRLGFDKVDENGVYFKMRWTPPQLKTAS